jgi:hypothetical protein
MPTPLNKITQKINWTRYLMLGSNIIAICVVLNGCHTRKEYSARSRWIYVNETNSNITHSFDTAVITPYDLDKKETKVFEEHGDGSKDMKASDYSPAITSFLVVYDLLLCDTIEDIAIANYEAVKLDDNYYQFTFRFTEKMVQQADTCR